MKMEYSLTEENELEMLNSDEYEIAKPFFDGFNTYASILHSILEKRSVGTIFTDDKSNPSFVLVCSSSVIANLNAPVYLGGKLDQDSLKKVIAYLKSLPKVSLVAFSDWEFRLSFEEAGFKPIDRLQLRRPFGFFNVDTLKKSLSHQYLVDKVNSENFSQCNWYSYLLSLYGDSDRFFNNGMGFCLIDQGKVAAESYGFIAKDTAEIGVITDKNYRNQNLGTIVSAFMLDYCYKNDIEPYWNCDISNPASAIVAKKLGFEENCRYLFLRWNVS